ncbi:WecB/TagA/CpsF family glycosyltransferase [Rhodopila sp.]|jgi:exopolysaccharide biosynthesis WecB/TagA/CpsF family protein|uniref:WecB/TagA/CpsF family glycosyltransferase n=1 Tax=Rhodopila sp. TaxID=2480087 RepID=UPI002C4A9CC4|nr:WecB/TagA/CpsF family glycosyltransferase [Rhodopila sp.]HVZ08117.1 WecB/TagA/CpsF family glycosyltransferase [Rhodopila sp.]
MTGRLVLAGTGFDPLDLPRAADWVAARGADQSFAYVVTPNADHLVRLAGDPALAGIYRDAALCLLDSRVVARLARLCGLPAPPVVPGSDLTETLLRRHLRPRERITIVGLAPRFLPELVARFGLAPPAHFDPPLGFDRDPAMLAAAAAFVRSHPARFIFLAVGSPRQERLAAAIARAGGAHGTALCVGASLDFLAGAQRRAPVAMQRAGLEWLFRLAGDPRRFARRYLVDSPKIIRLLAARRPGDPAPHI